MKQYWIVAALIFSPAILYAQIFGISNKAELANSKMQNSFCKYQSITMLSNKSFRLFPADSLLQKKKLNIYGDLTNDDTIYNRKYPLWIPALRVVGVNVFTWSSDKFILKESFADISTATWKSNLKNGWEWDKDRFGMNFIAHPYAGTLYFNAARSSGYNYFQSIPFAIGGSLMWEYFGENTRPSYNDLINTPVNGIFLGEIFNRLSSNILDDRTRGAERVFRELCVAIVSPSTAFNRLIQGKTWRITHKEVYQKEPCNISIFAGIRKINTEKEFLEGPSNAMLNLQIDYGNPFEERPRKPFDIFKIRIDLGYDVGRKLLDNVSGYGNLFARNHKFGQFDWLSGIFQYYDYYDNKTFELGTIGIGPGIISRVTIHNKSNLYTSFHLAAIPFGGSSERFGPDTTQYRDYNYGGGAEAKFESAFNLNKIATIKLDAYYFWVHTYVGVMGDNFVGVLKPRISINIIKNVSIGLEEYIYINDRFASNAAYIHKTQTEQKIFLLLFLENHKRKGRYN